MLLSLFLLVSGLHFGTVRAAAASCIDAAPPSSDWEHRGLPRDPRADTESGFIAVMRDYTLGCEGTVSQWKVQWKVQWQLHAHLLTPEEECQIFFNFHVLRPTSTCGIASIGNNSMTVEVASLTGSVQESVFNVSKADRISVKAGDVVGIAVMLEGCSRYSGYKLSIMESANESALSEVYYKEQEPGYDLICLTNAPTPEGDRDEEEDTDSSRSSYDDTTTEGDRDEAEDIDGYRSGYNDTTPEGDRYDEDDRDRYRSRYNDTTLEGDRYDEDDRDRYRSRYDDPTPEGDRDRYDSRYARRQERGGANTRQMRQVEEYQLYLGAPLIDAVVEKDVPTTVTDTPNVTPNLGSGGKDKPESEESQIGHFMIPTSVAAAVGSLLLITAAITVAACVCYHWRKQKVHNKSPTTLQQPELPSEDKSDAVDSKQSPYYIMNENMAYGVDTSPCSTTARSNDRHTGQHRVDNDAVDSKQSPHCIMNENMAYGMDTSPCSTTARSNDRHIGQHRVDDDAVDSKQSPYCIMNENMAYGMDTSPCSTTARSNDRHIGQHRVDDGIGRREGHYHIVDGSVYEVPSTD